MPTLIENKTLLDNALLCQSLGLKFIELNMNFPEYQVNMLEQTEYLTDIAKQTGIYYTIHLDENLNIADFNQPGSCLRSGMSMETALSHLL